jgi:Rrf2 family protein
MISSTARYALRAVVYLAGQPERYVNRAEISEATLVPHEYLLKVLHQLDAANLIESRRGPGGGYRLCMPAKDLTALDVVLAVDSIPRITECPLGMVGHEWLCPLHQMLDDASRRLEEAFAQTRITDLLPSPSSQTCEFPTKAPTK